MKRKKKDVAPCTVCQGDGYELMRRYGTLQSTGLPCPRKCPAGLKIARLQKEHEVYQVFRDINGMVYLRTGYTPKGAQYVVNKNFSVELVDLERYSTQQNRLALNPVPGASIKECARLLLHPVHDSCTIQVRAKQVLEQILNNKELEMKATNANARPTAPAGAKPAKFAAVTAPSVKGKVAGAVRSAAGKVAGAARAVAAKAKGRKPEDGGGQRQGLEEKAQIVFKIIGTKKQMPRPDFVAAMKQAFPSSYSTTAKQLETAGYIVRTADGVSRKK